MIAGWLCSELRHMIGGIASEQHAAIAADKARQLWAAQRAPLCKLCKDLGFGGRIGAQSVKARRARQVTQLLGIMDVALGRHRFEQGKDKRIQPFWPLTRHPLQRRQCQQLCRRLPGRGRSERQAARSSMHLAGPHLPPSFTIGTVG